MNIKLDKRLNTIISLISKGERIADIGSDHGKIAVLAVKKTDMTVIATDISEKSLEKAQILADENQVFENISFRVGDGLNIIEKNEVDTVIIAGMGGNEIINILTKSKFEYSKYILVPHQHSVKLRAYLIENGYNFMRDFIIKSDDKFYQFIVVDKKLQNPKQFNAFERLYGLELNDDFFEFRKSRLQKLEILKSKAKGESLENVLNEINLLGNINENKRYC